MRIVVALVGVALTVAAVPAVAKDRLGHSAISAGDLRSAEASLNGERSIFPRRPEVMLNLAVVYARTGRLAEARALYGAVLERDAIAMQTADGGEVSSHVIAERGLARLPQAVAVR